MRDRDKDRYTVLFTTVKKKKEASTNTKIWWKPIKIHQNTLELNPLYTIYHWRYEPAIANFSSIRDHIVILNFFFFLSDIHICSISPSATEQAAPTVQRICVYVRLCASCWSRPAFMHGLAGFWSYSFCGTFNSIFDSTEYAGPQLSMRWEMVSTCVRQHLGLDENPLYCKDRVQ